MPEINKEHESVLPLVTRTRYEVTRKLAQLQRLQQHQLRSPHCVDLTHGYGQGGN